MVKRFEKLFDFVVCDPCQSSPSLSIPVPLWFIVVSFVFYHLYEALFSGFLQSKVILSMVKVTQNTVTEPL